MRHPVPGQEFDGHFLGRDFVSAIYSLNPMAMGTEMMKALEYLGPVAVGPVGQRRAGQAGTHQARRPGPTKIR